MRNFLILAVLLASSLAAQQTPFPAIATAASPTYTEGSLVRLSVDLNGNLRLGSGGGTVNIAGTKSNNAGAPGATNLGVLLAIANAAVPSWTEGNQVGLSVWLDGALRAHGPVSSTSSAAAQLSIGTTAGQILAANANRKQVIIQNTGTTVIKLLLGAGTPTQTAYHVALRAGTAADDGTGGSFVTDLWTGAIQAISSAVSGTAVLVEQ